MYTKRKFNYIAITNDIDHAKMMDSCGVQQLMVDMEIIGKHDRQREKSTIISNHKIEDVAVLSGLNLNATIIGRVNSYHENSIQEIKEVVKNGADVIMIPMISSVDEYKRMVDAVPASCEVLPLIETPYSVFKLDEIIDHREVSQVHFGLNDLFISLKTRNLFEILFSNLFSDAVQYARSKVKITGIGGIGSPLIKQTIEPLLLIKMFYKLGANSVILSRSFFRDGCDADGIIQGINRIEEVVETEITPEEIQNLKSQVYSFFA